MGGCQFLLMWISGYVDISGKQPLRNLETACIFTGVGLSLHRDRLQCLLWDLHQLSVLPANAVTDPLAKHPCPPGWQLVFSQISPPPSLYPLQPQLRPTHIVCTWPESLTIKKKFWGPGINQTGCRRKHSLFCAARIFQQWLIFGMCLIWACRGCSLSWDFLVFFLGSLTES